MWGMAPLHNLSRSAKYEAFRRPLKQVIPLVDLPKQGELVHPIEIPDNLRTEDFYLPDFGLAIKIGDPTPRGYPQMHFCSPERLHGKEPSFACDMWSYMVLFAELYLGVCPFPPFLKGEVMTAIVHCIGPAPEQWKELYTYPDRQDFWYDEKPRPNYDIAGTIAYCRPDADPDEQKHVQSIMGKVFRYCPEERLTATQLLRDPSFVAIMDKYGC